MLKLQQPTNGFVISRYYVVIKLICVSCRSSNIHSLVLVQRKKNPPNPQTERLKDMENMSSKSSPLTMSRVSLSASRLELVLTGVPLNVGAMLDDGGGVRAQSSLMRD